MDHSFKGYTLVLALAVLTASCSTGGTPVTAGGGGVAAPQGGGVICPDIVTVPPPMIFPANGATGVPTNIGTIYFGGNGPGADIELTSSSGPAIIGGALLAAPAPLPSEVPTNGGSVSQASVPTLASSTTYSVTLVEPANPCPDPYGGSFASFTTQ